MAVTVAVAAVVVMVVGVMVTVAVAAVVVVAVTGQCAPAALSPARGAIAWTRLLRAHRCAVSS